MKIIIADGMISTMRNSFLLFCCFFFTGYAEGDRMKGFNIWSFIEGMQTRATELDGDSIKKLPFPIFLDHENKYTAFYKGKDFKLDDGNNISSIDIRLSKEKSETPAFIAFEISGECITLDELKKKYKPLELSSYPSGNSNDEVTAYTYHKNEKQTLSFGFKQTDPSCLHTVVIDSDE
ncbi:hypothetical protein PMPD1_0732 [Paramixta manurensis]|uniref:Uncharacterized protein n=1 Tax=Paramixta manurensis TaxID=2740817 RepID=A0A6M8U879_9GAMM|nr:hypothetical protein PMPD1_0732 [Erwiniaceae bacterium PD-1]